MIASPVIVSVPIDKKDYSKSRVWLWLISYFQGFSQEHFDGKGLRNIQHLIGNIDEPEKHVKRCPKCCNILCFYFKHKRFLPFKPAPYLRARIDLIAKFRGQCTEDPLSMGCRKPEGCLVKRHRICLIQKYA
jgi:hypothetical protein